MDEKSPDEIAVVGAGPNGLAAAIVMAEAGYRVTVYEAQSKPGGGAKSEELTLDGFIHDVCAAVHPMGVASPFFRRLPLEELHLEWIHPPFPCAHPLDGDDAVVLSRSIAETARGLAEDEEGYVQLLQPFVDDWENLFADILRPVFPLALPSNAKLLSRFGRLAMQSAASFAYAQFRGARARALFLGIAAHANCSLHRAGTAGIGLALIIAAHACGWPMARRGTQALTDALLAHFISLGGRLRLDSRIVHLRRLSACRAVFFDLMPDQAERIIGRSHVRAHRHGNGVFKIDWALRQPIPWRNKALAGAGTVHIGGDAETMIAAEELAERGLHAERPYVLLSQPSLFDSSRVPTGRHTAWAYCHVPAGSQVDMQEAIIAQVERLAPGFRDAILAVSTMTTRDIERRNANMVGGDIGGGDFTLWRSMLPSGFFRSPYFMGDKFYLCSSSTPPGPGVHGMCGFHAAHAALKHLGVASKVDLRVGHSSPDSRAPM